MEFDIKRVEMDEHFRHALDRLNEFMRANFKPEEIHAVMTSPWR